MTVKRMMTMLLVVASMHCRVTVDALPFPDDLDSFLETLFEHTECQFVFYLLATVETLIFIKFFIAFQIL